MLFCHITTQISGEKYADLLQEKGGQAFPYLAFMDAEGTVLAEHEGDRSVEAFEQAAKDVKSYTDLKKKIDAGSADKATKVDFFVVSARLRKIKLDEAQKQAGEFGDLTPEQKKKVDAALANLEVADALQNVPRDKESQTEIGKKFFEMKKAGRVPTDDGVQWGYWYLVLMYAESQKDAATYEEGLTILKAKYSKNARAKQMLDKMEKTLAQLKSEKK